MVMEIHAWVLEKWSMIMKSKNFQTCSKDVVGKHEACNLSLMYSPRLAQKHGNVKTIMRSENTSTVSI